MITRDIMETDFPELLAIERETQLSPWSMTAFEKCWEANYPGWVIELKHKVIGFILVTLNLGECHILNVCVAPTFQRRGLGTQLITNAITWAKNHEASVIYLEVRTTNIPAINLYRKLKFKPIGVRRNYYPAKEGREDALVFAKVLNMTFEYANQLK